MKILIMGLFYVFWPLQIHVVATQTLMAWQISEESIEKMLL